MGLFRITHAFSLNIDMAQLIHHKCSFTFILRMKDEKFNLQTNGILLKSSNNMAMSECPVVQRCAMANAIPFQ